MVADHADIAQRYVIELLEERDLTVLDALVDDRFVLRDPLTVLEGREALAARLRDTPFCDVMIIIEDVIAQDDRVVVRSTWQGIQQETFYGVKPMQRRVVLDVVQLLTLDNKTGKIVDDTTYFDVYALFEQLGALPPVEKLAEPKRLAPVLRLVPA